MLLTQTARQPIVWTSAGSQALSRTARRHTSASWARYRGSRAFQSGDRVIATARATAPSTVSRASSSPARRRAATSSGEAPRRIASRESVSSPGTLSPDSHLATAPWVAPIAWATAPWVSPLRPRMARRIAPRPTGGPRGSCARTTCACRGAASARIAARWPGSARTASSRRSSAAPGGAWAPRSHWERVALDTSARRAASARLRFLARRNSRRTAAKVPAEAMRPL